MRAPRAFEHLLSKFQPRKTHFGVFFPLPLNDQLGGRVRIYPRDRRERVRTVRRAADWLPGSYFIVLPLTHPESRICGNDTLQSGLCVAK